MRRYKAAGEKANLCGKNMAELRKQMRPKVSQRAFSELLQLQGVDVDKNAIQRIECGKRSVTDIELKAIAAVFQVSTDTLLGEDSGKSVNIE